MAIIFDLDGTLFTLEEYIPSFYRAMAKTLEGFGVTGIGESQPEMYPPFKLPLEQSREYIRNRWGVDPDEFWKRFIEMELEVRKACMGKEIRLYDDARVLERLKKRFKLGLMSNTPEDITKFHLEYAGLDGVFDAVVCGNYKCKLSKPETRGMKLCLERLGAKPENSVLVGDSDIDVKVGKRLGMITVQVMREHTYRFDSLGPDYTVYSLDEVEGLPCLERQPSAAVAKRA